MLSRVLWYFHVSWVVLVRTVSVSGDSIIFLTGTYSQHIQGFTYSNKSFLFSLKNHLNEQFKMFTYRHQQYAMVSGNAWGPVFGATRDSADLAIADRCNVNTFSHSELGWTYKPPNGYTYESPEARKLLAGSYNFTCDEYEEFYRK